MAQKKLVESGAGLAILPDFIVGNSLKKVFNQRFGAFEAPFARIHLQFNEIFVFYVEQE